MRFECWITLDQSLFINDQDPYLRDLLWLSCDDPKQILQSEPAGSFVMVLDTEEGQGEGENEGENVDDRSEEISFTMWYNKESKKANKV